MDEMHEVSLGVHHSVVRTVMRLSETVRAATGCTQVTLTESSELDEYRQVIIRATTIEACLRAEASLQRTQVAALVTREQAAGDMPSDDCVVVVFPLRNVVSMADDGTALMQPDPDNQVIIQYPRRLDLLAMGDDRAEVLQRIATVANVRGMEATELADIVAVSARPVIDNQGDMTSDVFRAVVEIVDLCHGARSQNRHAVEARRRELESEARVQAVEEEVVDNAGGGESGGEEDLVGPAGPAVVVGPPDELNLGWRLNLNAAGHAYLADWGLQLVDVGDGEEHVGSGWGRERPGMGPDPVVWTPRTQGDGNPQ